MPETIERRFRISGQAFLLRSREVERTMRRVEPEPIASHFVLVAGRRFPPKQVVSMVTGLDRADFTSHQARRVLMRLGFPAGRRGAPAATRRPEAGTPPERPRDGNGGELARRLRTLTGRWVATKGDDVLHDAATPQELVRWLTTHGQAADSMFRVPEDAVAASGVAPL